MDDKKSNKSERIIKGKTMEDAIFNRLKSYLDQYKNYMDDHRKHMDDRIDKLENMMNEFFTQGAANSNNITGMQESLKAGNEKFESNKEQHKEFYNRIKVVEDENNRISGGLKVIQIILIPLFLLVIGAVIKAFI